MQSINTKWILIPLFLAAILCGLVVPTFAQEQFGTVAGVVKDSSGAVIPNVAVTTNKDTNRAVTMQTRGDGSYTIPNIEPGHYSLLFDKTGFTRSDVPEVQVVVGRTTTVDIALTVGAVQEMVEVSEAALAVDTSTTMVSHNVTIDELNTLPKTRDFTGVAVFSPSVNTGYVDGGYQINGASGARREILLLQLGCTTSWLRHRSAALPIRAHTSFQVVLSRGISSIASLPIPPDRFGILLLHPYTSLVSESQLELRGLVTILCLPQQT